MIPTSANGCASISRRWVRSRSSGCLGGGSVYANGLIFALLDDGVVWLKADDVNAPLLAQAGSRQFTYPTKDGATMAMAYWSLPESALDDPDEAVDWARQSIDAALRKAANRKPRKPKPKP